MWDEGPLPDAVTIESRNRVGSLLLASLASTSAPEAAQECQDMGDRMHQDTERCLALLPTLSKARRRRAKDALPRYHETEYTFPDYIARNVDACVAGIQLSNLQDLPIDNLHGALPPVLARQIQDNMIKDGKTAIQSLTDLGCSHWLGWAPEDSASTGRLLATFRRWRRENPHARMSLLLLRPALPRDLPPEALRD